MNKGITLDLDGPLIFDGGTAFNFFCHLSRENGARYYETFVETGDWAQAIPQFNRPRLNKLWHDYRQEHDIHDEPTPGAIAVLDRLIGWRRYIATARGQNSRLLTEKFLHQHYGTFHDYHFDLECKVAAVEACGTSYFVDDNAGIAQRIVENVRHNVTVILFPAPVKKPRSVNHPRIRVLEAESYVQLEHSRDEWARICAMAWEEISSIVQPTMVPA